VGIVLAWRLVSTHGTVSVYFLQAWQDNTEEESIRDCEGLSRRHKQEVQIAFDLCSSSAAISYMSWIVASSTQVHEIEWFIDYQNFSARRPRSIFYQPRYVFASSMRRRPNITRTSAPTMRSETEHPKTAR